MKMKNQKGIALVSLVVTIIVLIILAGVAIAMGSQGLTGANENALLSELGIVQNAILQRKTKVDLTGEQYPGESVSESTLNDVIEEINANKASGEETVERKDNDITHYYLLTANNNGLSDLGITNSDDAYIVNYETGEVINYTTKVTEDGKPLYIYARESN